MRISQDISERLAQPNENRSVDATPSLAAAGLLRIFADDEARWLSVHIGCVLRIECIQDHRDMSHKTAGTESDRVFAVPSRILCRWITEPLNKNRIFYDQSLEAIQQGLKSIITKFFAAFIKSRSGWC
jgi:hypothetical protein